MITVSISVNAQPIYSRTAVNVKDLKDGTCIYILDDKSSIVHDPDDGAISLAMKMLMTIHEVKTKS